MINDIVTVARKEVQEILTRGGSSRGRRTILGAIVFPLIMAVFLGYEAGKGRNGVENGFAVFPIALLAMATAAQLITDAIAGERERHTLETLLASPVSDTAILAGKIGAVVGYVWMIALAQAFALGAASAAAGRIISPPLLGVVALLALLEAAMAAGLGVQFSLNAPTVRAAGRRSTQFSIVVNVIASAVNVVVMAARSGATRAVVVAVAVVVLVGANVILFGVAHARFQRGRLLLD